MEQRDRKAAHGATGVALIGGEGDEPLVMLHGFPFDPRMWDPQLHPLGKDARILAPHLLGLGQSRVPEGVVLSIDDYAEDVVAWMDTVGISRATIAGLSMGGYVALAMWKRAPERIKALALLDTKAEADSEEARRGRIATSRTLSEKGMAGVVDGMLPKVLSATTRRTKPEVVERVRAMILESDAVGAMAAVEALRTRPDRSALLATIDVPVVVVVGEEDELTPPSVARELANGIAGAKLIVITGAGHVTSLETPDRVTAVLRSLLLQH